MPKRAIVIVLDSVGIGAAPDASEYGDAGAATLQHTAAAVGGIDLPTLGALGLGNCARLASPAGPILGVPACTRPLASFGVLREVSEGKDTITGHWEIAGLLLKPGFRVFPPGFPSFPAELIAEFERRTQRAVICNRAADGTAVIEAFGPAQIASGAWIVYTSADSVFQIAAHTDVIPLAELYAGCRVARELCDPFRIGRVIARPFHGTPGALVRTAERRDYPFRPFEATVLEHLTDSGIPTFAVGKIDDIFAHGGIAESVHSGTTADSQQAVMRYVREKPGGLIMANFIDFDMVYGHRRDAAGYAVGLVQTDAWLAGLLPELGADDVLVITADHGNDPTFRGTDHTRELVPLLAFRVGRRGRKVGVRAGLFDIAQTLATWFGIPPMPRGESFLGVG